MKALRAYRYRFYPTPEQVDNLSRTFGCVRWVYNWGLALRSAAFFERQERLFYKHLAALLPGVKKTAETEWLNEVSSVCLQQALRHLDTAFTKFFKKESAYPTRKRRKDGAACTYMSNAFTLRDGQLTLAKQSTPLDIRWSRRLPSNMAPTSVTISRSSGNRYFISLLVEEEINPLPASRREIGVDLNTAEVVCSNGQRFKTPAQLKVLEIRKSRYQRAYKRKVSAAKVKLGLAPNAPLPKGTRLPISNNLRLAFLKVGRVSERAANIRRDWQHKLTTTIVRENQVIAMEDLNVRGMTASAAGTADAPGVKVRQKAGLNRAILGVGFSEIQRQLIYKARWAGRSTVKIDRWYPSSKRCSICGHTLKHLALSQRHWRCPECETHHDRDENAAKNILRAGKAVLAGADAQRGHE